MLLYRQWRWQLRWLLRAIVWVGFGLAQLASASNLPVLALTPHDKSISSLGAMGIHVDPTAAMTLDEARQADYATVARQRSGGFSPAAHWYHFKVMPQPQVPSDWVLALGEPFLDDIKVWTIAPDGTVKTHQLGDHFAFSQHPIKTHSPAIHLDLSATGPTDVFVRVQSISALNFNATLWQPDAFFAHESQVNLVQGLYFGVLLVVVLINLLFSAWLRDAGMLAFAGYAFSLILFFLGLKGYAAMLLPAGPAWLIDAVTGIGVIAGIAAAVTMWSQLLALRDEYPKLNWAYLAMALLCVAMLPFAASAHYRIVAPALFKLSILYMFSALILVALLWHRNKKLEFLFYLLAVLTNVIGVLTQMTIALGWLSLNTFTENAHQFLSVVQALFMTLGLMIRIGQFQSDRLKLQHEMDMAHQRAQEQRRFVAMLSHEFRTPLAVIDRSAQMIFFNTPALADPEAHRVQTIRANAGMLSTLVDSFLTTESIQHNQLAVRLESCGIRDFLESESAALGEDMAARIQIEMTASQQNWTMDKTLMGMALRNILINALRYSPQNSPVSLTATVDHLGLHIVVTDGGPGLSTQELQQLGQPYYRAASSGGKQGTGLGYYFSSRIMAAHGATLEAHNAAKGGLVVTMSLARPQVA